jgi:peptidyl-prolyl cis-trans isomerase B (cyclophilin B)
VTRRLVLALAVLALAGCGGDDDPDSAPGGTTATTTTAPGACTDAEEAPDPRQEGGATKETKLPADKRAELVVGTNCGTFTIKLDPKAAPKAVASVAGLAESGFYDDTTFHRIVPGFVIQGGDPTATGTGGPGYSTVDTPPETTRYTKGVVAMAKTQMEDPGTSGSQFFVVTAPDAGLPPDYAIVGKVASGQDVVDRIAKMPTSDNEQPIVPVIIEKATLQGT